MKYTNCKSKNQKIKNLHNVFFDRKIKLKINNNEISRKPPSMNIKLGNTFLYNPLVKEKNQREIRKYFKLNYNNTSKFLECSQNSA